ncbi:MAG: hypothetical protein COV59_04415 [Candidatus Magasanikbacteria bacterium CG11_big_fil_rev_8_21_14_0_20_39_34]|uniref:Glycosyltransferase RgtA/B/C/D-like domain-containing protein n=1 Tax=Candidatus Magasanikbacteria bacterium CG11_big_fil_rev_8_21_14_0_20_39_34 TaxID=1974653 RepID=A0A2H0N4Q5_9BACT|nr:MAG: hypothetical protein COV59_04415 [Candidatus Magasanikbacteria bacterium CG11_big_fil_rev_8_21_14_0_20_39_34]
MYRQIQNFLLQDKILLIVFCIFLITRLVIIFFFPMHISDIHFFFEKASQGVLQKLQIYQDFTFPYPPLSIPFFYIPIWFGKTFESFRFYFQIEMFIIDCISFFYLFLLTKNRLQFTKTQVYFILLLFTYFGLFEGLLLYDRLDMVITLFLLMMLYYYLSPNKWHRSFAYVLASFGTLIKVIPLFFIPIFFVLDLTRQKNILKIKTSLLNLTFYLIPIVLCLGIFHIHTHGNIWESLAEHKQRGIQIESTWATPFMLKNLFHSTNPTEIITKYGAQHIVDKSIPKFYLQLSKYLGFFILFLFYIVFFFQRIRKNTFPDPSPYKIFSICFSLLIFLLLSQRVLSPQYFLWTLPFFCIYIIKKGTRWVLFFMTLLYILTFIGFKWYNNFMHFESLMVFIVTLRNILLIGFGVSIIHGNIFINDTPQPAKEAS